MTTLGQRYRLAHGPSSLGLSCDDTGVTLAGVQLLRMTVAGLVPRSTNELAALLKGAYGRDIDPARISSGLDVVARALNQGDLARAAISALQLKLSELDWDGATGIARADEALAKYDQSEPRDWHGRWTTGAGGGSSPSATAHTLTPSRSPRPSRQPNSARVADRQSNASPNSAPTSGTHSNPTIANSSGDTEFQVFQALYPRFQQEFDELGPVEFAKRVTNFGVWLGQNYPKFTPKDLLKAKAEYFFLQDRLGFWVDWKYMPPEAHANILSAASILYAGAINAGLVRVGQPGGWPKSMNAVVVASMAYDNAAPEIGIRRLGTAANFDLPLPIGIRPPRLFTGAGDMADGPEVQVEWGKGINAQGDPWERFLQSKLPPNANRDSRRRTWDFQIKDDKYVISAKTLDTTAYTYAKDPKQIFYRMKKYIDQAANYKLTRTHRPSDVDPRDIAIKQIHLATPFESSPEQQMQLFRAIHYGKTRGVSVMVTRVR